MDPDSGRLTGADSGPGRLPEPEAIAWIVQAALAKPDLTPDLRGRHVVISGGGTRERLDPVRHIGNRSSGKQAMSLAAAAVSRGARVTLIRGDVDVPDPGRGGSGRRPDRRRHAGRGPRARAQAPT